MFSQSVIKFLVDNYNVDFSTAAKIVKENSDFVEEERSRKTSSSEVANTLAMIYDFKGKTVLA